MQLLFLAKGNRRSREFFRFDEADERSPLGSAVQWTYQKQKEKGQRKTTRTARPAEFRFS